MPRRRHHQEIPLLLGEHPLAAYEQGRATLLVSRRNRHLGALFTAERSAAYVNILYRMLLFKREHELEPLYDDIFSAVYPAQTALGEEYSKDRFRADLEQLAQWGLVSFRIEKQRLRGYRDNRKRKFRYRLSDEAACLLEWLEERLLDDLRNRGSDARDLLGEVRGALGELLRLLHQFRQGQDGEEDIARRVLFQLFKTSDLSQEITAGLSDFNGKLLLFLVRRYQAAQARELIEEIHRYVQVFLKQTYALRLEIMPLLDRLRKPATLAKLAGCHEIMEKERLRAPNLLQVRRDLTSAGIPDRLARFFAEQGGLDRLLHRINESSLRVWRKLRSHLRELERKNNRLDDLRCRISEMATLAEDAPARAFLSDLLAQPLCRFDPNYWSGHEKAEPPRPKKRLAAKASFPRTYLRRKQKTGKPVQSLDEARLARLKEWLEERVISPDTARALLSRGDYHAVADYPLIMELARSGLLGDGRRLARIDFSLRAEGGEVVLAFADRALICPEMTIARIVSDHRPHIFARSRLPA